MFVSIWNSLPLWFKHKARFCLATPFCYHKKSSLKMIETYGRERSWGNHKWTKPKSSSYAPWTETLPSTSRLLVLLENKIAFLCLYGFTFYNIQSILADMLMLTYIFFGTGNQTQAFAFATQALCHWASSIPRPTDSPSKSLRHTTYAHPLIGYIHSAFELCVFIPNSAI